MGIGVWLRFSVNLFPVLASTLVDKYYARTKFLQHREYSASPTKNNRLILFRKNNVVYSENKQCAVNSFNIKEGVTYRLNN
jgi:hypothetical protein